MKKRFARLSAVVIALAVPFLTPVATAADSSSPQPVDPVAYLREHGYLPIHGADTLAHAKAYAEAQVASQQGTGGTVPTSPLAPTIGSNWAGIRATNFSPPDPNGAIGPQSYIEVVNLTMAIYKRTGAPISSLDLTLLTGDPNLSDPMVLWDPDTQRFYYNVWDFSNSTQRWGFSKSANPTLLPADFCNYSASFGYPANVFTDYPKLGQTKQFLMIGVNFYPTPSSLHASESDLLWITKPQGKATITTCPLATTFHDGKFTNLRNQDGTQAFTPVPAIQTDPSSTGYISAMSDIECPDICGNGALITLYSLMPGPGSGAPVLSAPRSVKVKTYTSPPSAPEKGTTSKIDTLDGRLTHSTSGIDPRFHKTAVWLGHTVLGGAGSQIRWYEVDAASSPLAVLQAGVVTNPSLYVLNAGISSDRTVNAAGAAAHGDAMVLGFTTSSKTTFPADQMVSKIGAAVQSAFVLVRQSTTYYRDFTCSPGPCRWGDYGGATSDPAASLTAPHGEVWLSNEWANRAWETQNWEAKP
jgi:hypothetical protein